MKRHTVIACSSLKPELEMLAARYGARMRYLEIGLHQLSAAALRAALQDAIDAETDCETIALAYGLCNQGIVGITAQRVPVAVPRAHDCIAILLGSRRYLAELESRPGTYFQSAGWLEAREDVRQPDFTFGPDANATREQLAARYGDDNADYLVAQLDGFLKHYDRLVYIATAAPVSGQREREAEANAARLGWNFERLEGDLGRLDKLVRGPWNDEEFLILKPGERLALAFDDGLIKAEPA